MYAALAHCPEAHLVNHSSSWQYSIQNEWFLPLIEQLYNPYFSLNQSRD